MRFTRPLFRPDPGWLFIIAGMAMCIAVVLIPAKHDLFVLRSQGDALRSEELHNNARLRRHVDFLQAVDGADPDLARRLVASQLNLVPQGETPVVLVSNPAGAVQYWLDAATSGHAFQPQVWPETTLSRLANGPRRIWLMGGGVMCVFLGLLTGGAFGRPRESDGEAQLDESQATHLDEIGEMQSEEPVEAAAQPQ